MAAPPLYSRLGYLSGRAVPTGSVTISDVTNGANIYGVAPLNSGVGESLRSNRDLAMIAILLGCGLRRAELASLRMEDVQIRQGHWAIVDLVGKGGHVRTVPMPNWVKGAVDKWTAAAQVTHGRIFRAVSRHGSTWGRGISENVVWYVVRSCAGV
jgi:integrase